MSDPLKQVTNRTAHSPFTYENIELAVLDSSGCLDAMRQFIIITYIYIFIHSSAGERVVSPVLGRVLARMLLGASLAIEMQKAQSKCVEMSFASVACWSVCRFGKGMRYSWQV